MERRVEFDTGVIISYCGRPAEPERENKARAVVEFLKNNDFEILYSQRTKHELEVVPTANRSQFMEEHTLSRYFIGNQNWEETDGTWENIGSNWDNKSTDEHELAERIKGWLIKERDLKDRGILLDAIKNNCRYFVHENPKDYNKIPTAFFEEFNIKPINLLDIDLSNLNAIFV